MDALGAGVNGMTHSGYTKIGVTIERIDGDLGLGSYRMTVGLDLSLESGHPDKEVILFGYGGSLVVRGQEGGDAHVGYLEPKGYLDPITARHPAVKRAIYLDVELDRQRLKALEDMRRGQNLTFTVHFWALVWGERGVLRLHPTEPPSRRVNQADWAEIHQKMGAGRSLLLEIPEPDAQAFPELAAAVEHWREAWNDSMRGANRDAVAKCRLMLEALPASPPLPRDPRERNKAERYEQVRHSLTALCNAAHHTDDVCARITWERNDAEVVVGMSAALLKLYTGSR